MKIASLNTYFLVTVITLFTVLQSNKIIAADQLDGISVTATRTERSIFDTPDTVSRVGQDEMDRNQVQKLSDVLKDIPGVSFSNGPRAIAEKPLIRGLGGNRILITVDGVRQNFNSGHKGRVFVETELLKTVEVLRGPGSAVYGSGAMGGVIAMTTKDATDFLMPEEKFGVRLKLGYQDVNEDKMATGILFGATESASLDYILSATRRSSEDIRLGGGEILEDSAEDTWAGLAKLNWAPVDNHRFTVSRQYTFDSGEVPAQADLPTSATAVLTDRETEVTIDRIAYRYDNPDNDWVNLDFFVYNNEQDIREKRIGTTEARLDVIDFDTRGVDLRNSSSFKTGANSGHRISYGIEYYQDMMSSVKGAGPNLAFPDATADFIGIYLQDEFSLDSWVLIPGVRYDKYKSTADQVVVGAAESTEESQVSPKLGLIYKVTDWMNLSFNYGQAFRAPSFQELYISGVHFGANNFVPNPNLKPEKLKHGVETGVRVRLKDMSRQGDRLSARASVYYNEYSDFIDSIVTTTITTFDNISEARIHGAELEAIYYTSLIDLESTFNASYSIGDNLTDDQPLSGIPGHSLTFNLQKFVIQSDLSFGLRGSFHLEQDRVVPGQPITEAYNLYDLYLTWAPLVDGTDDLQVIFGVDNFTDEAFKPHLSTLPGPGRNVKVSMSLQF